MQVTKCVLRGLQALSKSGGSQEAYAIASRGLVAHVKRMQHTQRKAEHKARSEEDGPSTMAGVFRNLSENLVSNLENVREIEGGVEALAQVNPNAAARAKCRDLMAPDVAHRCSLDSRTIHVRLTQRSPRYSRRPKTIK